MTHARNAQARRTKRVGQALVAGAMLGTVGLSAALVAPAGLDALLAGQDQSVTTQGSQRATSGGITAGSAATTSHATSKGS